ncbi:MAG TPA: hypothetical protein VGR57_17990, partial [Ktedonobacterales bacterium]|nr:hypothetical protein [Ktedonobacterales bacterium]
MSATLMEHVWRTSRAKGSAKMVLLAIANAAGDDQMADLTISEIAAAAEIKERQTQRCLRAIEALGELVIATVHGRAQRNHFIVTLSLEKVSPTTPFSDRTSEKVSPMTPFSDEKASPMTPIAEKASSMTPFPLAPPDMPDRSN